MTTATGPSVVKKYYSIARAFGAVDLFREHSGAPKTGAVNLLHERFGDRELPGLLWVSDTLEAAIEKAEKWAAANLGQ